MESVSASASASENDPFNDDAVVSLFNSEGEIRSIDDIKKDAIFLAIVHCDGNIILSTRHLGIGRSTLYRKLSEYSRNEHSRNVGR